MYCPDCGAEYDAGVTRCPEHDVALVAERPDLHPEPESYETILELSDVSAIPLVKSVLEGGQIPFLTQGEGLVNLFPAAGLGTLSSLHTGEVKIKVPAHLADEARRLLEMDERIASPGQDPPDGIT